MYLIYIRTLSDNNIKLLDFSETSEEAYKLMEDHAREFINDNEGKKKWDSVFIDEHIDCSKLKDGYFYIKKNNTIEVFNKTSEIINTGWILNSQETHHKMVMESVYSIIEFPKHMLNKFITDIPHYSIPNPPINKYQSKIDIPDILKPNVEIRYNLDNIIDEIKRVGFKPTKRNKVKND